MGDIGHQMGFAEELNYGVAVTPTRFLEFTTESLERRATIVTSAGIRAGRRYGGAGRRTTREDAAGSMTFEVARQGFGLFFEHLLGDAASAQPNAGSSPTVWEHTFTPGTLIGKSLTLQKGVDTEDGTVEPFTYPGTKIVSADFSNDQDGLLMVTLEFDAREEETSTALATATYTDPVPFTYAEGTVQVDDVTMAAVRSVSSLRIQNNFNRQRFFLGSGGLKSEPINTPFDTLGGRLDVEFQDPADFYDLFVGDTAAKLELYYVGGIIEDAYTYELHFTLNNVRFEGETPKVTGPELVYQNIPFVGLDHASLDAITILYRTNDTAP